MTVINELMLVSTLLSWLANQQRVTVEKNPRLISSSSYQEILCSEEVWHCHVKNYSLSAAIVLWYSSWAENLRPVQKLFPSLGKRKATETGCNANNNHCYAVAILGLSVRMWLSVACKPKSDSCPMKNYSCVHYARRSMKLQEMSFSDNTCHMY